MEKICLLILASLLLVSSAFARQKGPAESLMLKVRQQQELRALRLKQKYVRRSLKHSGLPKAVRIQLKHDLKREARKLRQRQRDERQALKDRQRLLRLEMKQFGTD